MKNFVCCLLLLGVAVISGCVATSPLPPLMSSRNMELENNSVWRDYGAVYSYDELRVITSFNPSEHAFSTTYTVNQAIRILDKSGMKHGTIHVHKYDGQLQDFSVAMRDARGKSMPLDQAALKAHYIDTGEVVVPRVQPGCEITLQLKFHSNEPLSHHDHVYSRPLPVEKSRFAFLSSNDFSFTHKSYEIGDESVQEVGVNSLKGFMVTKENVRPISDLFEEKLEFLADSLDFSDLPRTTVQLKSFWVSGYSYTAPDWKKIAEDFNRFYYSPSLFSSREKLKQITEELLRHEFDNFQRADVILKHVQDNFALQNYSDGSHSRINIDQVLRAKTGNTLELSLILSEMMKAANLETRSYITRQRRQGSFDPEIASWSQLHFPLVAVKVDGRELIAFPFAQGYELGEYPAKLEGLYGLDIDQKKPAPLPPSVDHGGTIQSLVDISLTSAEDSVHSWEYVLTDHFAANRRPFFHRVSDYDLKRTGKSILESYENGHELFKVTLDPVRRGDDITLQMRFENDNMQIENGNDTAFSLSPYFRKYFTSYVEADGERFNNDMEMTIEEEVHLRDVPRESSKLLFSCEEMDNVLFSVHCSEQKSDNDVIVGRTLKIKKGELTHEDLQQLLPDIRRLNRISESQLVYRR